MSAMKRFLTFATIVFATALTAAAQVRTSYFVEGTNRSQFNPAFAPNYGYLRLPVVGGFDFNLDGTLSLNDFFVRNPNGPGLTTILSNSVSEAEALKGFSKNMNSFYFNNNINLFGFGSYAGNGKNFWSVDMNLHTEAALDIPYEFFRFLKTVSDGENVSDFSALQLMAQSYADIGFNYSLPLTDKIFVGARAKLLVGIAHADVRMNSFKLTTGEERWSAEMQAEMDLNIAGLPARAGQDLDEVINNFKNNKIKGVSGYGFAIDLGASWQVQDNLQVSAAVNDLGFISWGSGTRLATDDKSISFSGVDMTMDANGVNPKPLDFTLDDLGLSVVGDGQGKTTPIRATVNVGAEYEVLPHQLGIGLLYHGRMGLYVPSHNLTASLSYHPVPWFTVAPSYTLNSRGGALGLALNFAPRGFNLFLATDVLTARLANNLYIPYRRDRMTFSFGMAVNLGRRGQRIG